MPFREFHSIFAANIFKYISYYYEALFEDSRCGKYVCLRLLLEFYKYHGAGEVFSLAECGSVG